MSIKGIRNAFAHHLHGLSFSDPDIVKEVDKLRAVMQGPPEFLTSARGVYLSATLSAQMEMWSTTESIAASQRRCKVPEWRTLVSWKRDEPS